MPEIRKKSRPEKLAVDVADLGEVDEALFSMLFSGKLSPDPVRVNPDNQKEVAAVFDCPLITAATVCDILHSEQRKARQSVTRVYLNRGDGKWVRLSSLAVFTHLKDGKAVLNPAVFGAEAIDIAKATPIAAQPFTLGKKIL